MNERELKELLTQLDLDINNQLTEFFNNNAVLKSKFSRLIHIIILENGVYSREVVDKLESLTDNMDSFNFGIVKEDIDELMEML